MGKKPASLDLQRSKDSLAEPKQLGIKEASHVGAILICLTRLCTECTKAHGHLQSDSGKPCRLCSSGPTEWEVAPMQIQLAFPYLYIYIYTCLPSCCRSRQWWWHARNSTALQNSQIIFCGIIGNAGFSLPRQQTKGGLHLTYQAAYSALCKAKGGQQNVRLKRPQLNRDSKRLREPCPKGIAYHKAVQRYVTSTSCPHSQYLLRSGSFI